MKKAGFSDSLIVLSDDNCTIKERTNNSGRIKNNMKLSNKEKLTFAQGANKIAEKVLTKYNLQTTMAGDIQEFIDQLQIVENAERLKEGTFTE